MGTAYGRGAAQTLKMHATRSGTRTTLRSVDRWNPTERVFPTVHGLAHRGGSDRRRRRPRHPTRLHRRRHCHVQVTMRRARASGAVRARAFRATKSSTAISQCAGPTPRATSAHTAVGIAGAKTQRPQAGCARSRGWRGYLHDLRHRPARCRARRHRRHFRRPDHHVYSRMGRAGLGVWAYA